MKNVIKNPNQKVVITFDNNKTLARIYEDNKVVTKGVAICSPEDEFDLKLGSELALSLALESMTKKPEFRKVTRPPVVGDYIKIVSSIYPCEKHGDIYKISVIGNCSLGVRHGDHPAHKELFKNRKHFSDDYIWWHNIDLNCMEILEKV